MKKKVVSRYTCLSNRLFKGGNIIKRKPHVVTVILILGTIFLLSFLSERKGNAIGHVLVSIPTIDTIQVKDGQSKNHILTISNKDPHFTEMVDVFDLPYYGLKWSERKLIRGKPFMNIEYLENGEIQYKVDIYQVPDKHLAKIPDDVITDRRTNSKRYSPEGSDHTYIFAIKKVPLLIGVNEGIKELMERVLVELNR